MKILFTVSLLMWGSSISVLLAQKPLSPEQVVQSNLDAYNARDIEGFMAWFSPDIALYQFGMPQKTAQGLEEIEKIYAKLFEASPQLHSKILKRIVFGNKVIDHEYITGRRGGQEPLELVLVYEVADGKIFKITVMRQ